MKNEIALNAETVSVEEVVKDIVADVAQNGDGGSYTLQSTV